MSSFQQIPTKFAKNKKSIQKKIKTDSLKKGQKQNFFLSSLFEKKNANLSFNVNPAPNQMPFINLK